MDPHTLRIVSRGKTPATGRLEHLPKLWLHAPVRFELSCAAPDDTEAALSSTPTYAISIHSLDAARQPVDEPLLWYAEVDSETANDGKSKGPHAIFDLSAADIANITAAGEYWIAFHASSGGERIPRAAGYITFADDGFPDSPPTPTPPGTVYLTQAVGDSRYVRDPGTVVDNRLVRWDGVTGNMVQSSAITVDDSGNMSTPGTFTASRVKVKTGTFESELTSSLLTSDREHALPNADGTLALTANVNGAPDRMEIYVKCAEAAGVTMGQAVYISGASGSNKLITKAIASGESTSSKTIGLVMQNLAHNGFGYVVTEGRIEVSLAAGTAVEGDPVWLSPSTAGGLVYGLANKPSAPNHMVFLGYVTRINGGTITQIYVKVQNGFELEELHNVAITSPSTGHVLTWNGTAWVNSNPSGGGGGGGSVTITGNDGIGVAGSPGTSITLSLGHITPDSLNVSGLATFQGSIITVHSGFETEISSANVTGGGNLHYIPDGSGTYALVANATGAITATEITDSTTVGRNILKLTNPGAITFLRMNADNTVSALSDSSMRTALGLGNVATRNVGTTTGTAAAGDDSRFHAAVTLASSVADIFTLSGQELRTGSFDQDTLVFFDQSANKLTGLTLGAGLTISGTVISAPAGGGGSELQIRDSATGAVAAVTGTSVSGTTVIMGAGDNLGTGTAERLKFRNTTPAVNNTVQNSPAATWEGQAWNPVASASQPMEFRSYLAPIQLGGGSPGGRLVFESRTNSGSWTEMAHVRFQQGLPSGFWVSGSIGSSSNAITVVLNNSTTQMTVSTAGSWILGPFSVRTGSSDATLNADAAHQLAQRSGTNAQVFRVYDTFASATDYQRVSIATARAVLSGLSGASVTATSLIPAGAVVVGVTAKVLTAVTGATSWQLGTAADPDRFAAAGGIALGSTTQNADWTAGGIECFPAATNLILTANGSNFTAGSIQISVQYLRGEAD